MLFKFTVNCCFGLSLVRLPSDVFGDVILVFAFKVCPSHASESHLFWWSSDLFVLSLLANITYKFS